MNKISETAYLVAMYRALESERPDALFRDSWARLLAGGKGLILAEMLGAKTQAANIVATRTYLIDRTLEQLIRSQPIDTVVNLGAGLDTRPYRLSLPPSLQWIEVDLPDILLYKETQLQKLKPLCQLKRVRLDLANLELRKVLFAEISATAGEVLVITEGLLSYLSEEQVSLLAEDLRRQPNFRWWLFELISAFGRAQIPLQWRERLFHQYFSNNNNTSVFLFNPEQGLDFFQQRGWKIARFYSAWKESRRLKRGLKFAALLELLLRWFARQYWQALEQQIGVALLERSIPISDRSSLPTIFNTQA
ncbi:S-adenosyl-L-methionine-dependent methyltransferase [Hyella patelloides LEGE 07179]|uniref:S-adenosyl-L-methionine-dependent methyltransferase n=1 Tax=Hyella patelloides LEGE 07179 TaxID=945734 RepID=A0A563W059_9CYAN|nr:SAM-dependent methyltransferase [Hyella patelloides]VEP17098.1 S-adenosyl-L-methionine-dependent methyltransferase [Hyella patelloides LEGE 07179]